jgi:hypothetical protein
VHDSGCALLFRALKGVDERHEHERAHNGFQLVLAEAAVAAVMSHHKQLQGTVTRPGQARSIFVVSIYQMEQHIKKHNPLTEGMESLGVHDKQLQLRKGLALAL